MEWLEDVRRVLARLRRSAQGAGRDRSAVEGIDVKIYQPQTDGASMIARVSWFNSLREGIEADAKAEAAELTVLTAALIGYLGAWSAVRRRCA
jgi:hypothetical protein